MPVHDPENTCSTRTLSSEADAVETEKHARTRHDMHGQWPRAESVQDFRDNLLAVRKRIEQACERAGRDPSSVRLLPVSKTMDEKHIRLAHEAGCTLLGENKVQEAWQKAQAMNDLTDLKWSVIGHLQRNKARVVARFASEFQALDSMRLAVELDKRLLAEDRSLDVYVQVNTSEEESKYGLALPDVIPFLEQLRGCDALNVKGLMTLAEFTRDEARIRACFVRLRELRDHILDLEPGGYSPHELSMGMSGDFEVAIEEGATVVRVGQAIFGARSLPDEYFWPGIKGENR
ncbi:YggS family pyridoxal phosphate-dependent enzyme [Phytobacter diazotrophicus]|uniref:Pyridoxal phosphate homeostasis protein n=2 Tax=Enterobacteriaceae TaxID=543 RepID=A0ABM7VW83_9ENTR|nr:YggS family pyridoxal phosphate enzyme [Phytobacter diazotrophicus]BEG82490.1 YggS family pyridoxal phosphate-dependent enzyme [Phytobacter diazotrophicus]BEG88292.1 YggS family pyridoxal phosphate-dependent enzyme [Phytobacter diazotrophicus]BEG94084.1 YggS family pyridoxal phosphate-dependent enzyme [Phytobacter diazotrophicus]